MRGGVKALVVVLVAAAVAAGLLYTRRTDVAPQPVMQIILETGKTASVPYLMEEGIVWAVTDEPWWRHLGRDGDGVTVVIEGETAFGRARAVEDDHPRRSAMLARLRSDTPSPDDVLLEVKLAPWSMRRGRGSS